MARSVRGDGPAVMDLNRLFDKVVEVLKRVLQPLHFGQRAGHVDADFEKGIAQGDRYARCAASQPMRMTSVTWPWTLRMSVAPAIMQLPLARDVEILARIDHRDGALTAEQPQAFEIVPQDRILDPEQVVAGVLDR